jgi:hypothetical protein
MIEFRAKSMFNRPRRMESISAAMPAAVHKSTYYRKLAIWLIAWKYMLPETLLIRQSAGRSFSNCGKDGAMQRDLLQLQSGALPDDTYVGETLPLSICGENSSRLRAYEVLKNRIEKKGLVVLSTPSLRLGYLTYLAFFKRIRPSPC